MLIPLPYIPLFLFFLLLGPIISLTASNWLSIWLGLEINLMSFIPLLSHSKSLQESEAATKYFLTQACAGLALLWGLITTSSISTLLITTALLLKLGAAPLHFWLPSVMNSIPWPQVILLTTWQKLAPIFILTSLPSALSPVIMATASISALTGSIMALNQTQLRTIMAYSSINHLGWMLASSLTSLPLTLLYFFLYITMTSSIIFLFLSHNLSLLTSLFLSPSNTLLLMMLPLLLSLAGVPPLTGFAPKAMILFLMMKTNLTFLAAPLLLSSVISLYFYLSISYSFMPKSSLFKPLFYPKPHLFTSLLLLTATLSIPLLIKSPLYYALTIRN